MVDVQQDGADIGSHILRAGCALGSAAVCALAHSAFAAAFTKSGAGRLMVMEEAQGTALFLSEPKSVQTQGATLL